jgi:homoserine dehydrogenase
VDEYKPLLNGMDVARKVVIAAREAGLDLSLEDITVQGLVPKAGAYTRPLSSST